MVGYVLLVQRYKKYLIKDGSLKKNAPSLNINIKTQLFMRQILRQRHIEYGNIILKRH